MLVKAGSGVATLGIPGSAGVPAETAMHTLALPFNDLDAVRAAFAARPNEIACIIVEPVVGNAGTIPPAPGYLEGLRKHHSRARRAPDPRRGDDRLPRLPRRSPAALRHPARPHHPRQDHRRRPALRSLRRTRRHHGTTSPRSAPSIRPEPSAEIRSPWPPESPPCSHLIDHEADDLLAARQDHRRHRRRRGRDRHARRASPSRPTASAPCSPGSSPAKPVTDFASAATSDTARLRHASTAPCSMPASGSRRASSKPPSSPPPTARPRSAWYWRLRGERYGGSPPPRPKSGQSLVLIRDRSGLCLILAVSWPAKMGLSGKSMWCS